jgi:hypothetical protein
LTAALAMVIPLVATSAFAATPEGKSGWYPRAGDLCAEYVAKTSKPEQYGALLTQQAARDPAIAKYIAEFNAASGTNDKGAKALAALLTYCDAHATKKIGDVTAQAVIALVNPSNAGSSAQPAASEAPGLDAWYRQLIYYCGNDNECKRLSKKAYDDAVACGRGDAAACSEGNNNLQKLDPWLDAWLETWHRQLLAECAADTECNRIAKNAYDHGFGCNRGDANACSAKHQDEVELTHWKETHGK